MKKSPGQRGVGSNFGCPNLSGSGVQERGGRRGEAVEKNGGYSVWVKIENPDFRKIMENLGDFFPKMKSQGILK